MQHIEAVISAWHFFSTEVSAYNSTTKVLQWQSPHNRHATDALLTVGTAVLSHLQTVLQKENRTKRQIPEHKQWGYIFFYTCLLKNNCQYMLSEKGIGCLLFSLFLLQDYLIHFSANCCKYQIDIAGPFWLNEKKNKTGVERRQTLGPLRSINPNMINHFIKQSPLLFSQS